MTVGEKIKRIRIFRKMTQKELGLAVGLTENRIAQYETNYRTPKKELLNQIAEALHVNSLNFYVEVSGSAEDIIQTFFWMDELNPNTVNLFQMTENLELSTEVEYKNSDSWTTSAPVGIFLNYNLVNQFLAEWLPRKTELKNGQITKKEYFEWKLNFPYTCDGGGKFTPSVQWRNS